METHSQLCLVLVITLYFSSLAQSGTHLDKPWFRWSGGKVPFFFQVSVSNSDRVMIRHMMRQIEGKTCIRFKEKNSENPPPGHHLEIKVLGNSSCVQQGIPRFSAAVYAEPPTMQKVILYSSYKLADKTECWGKARGGLLHEIMHMFGVMHTQMRADRDKYITIYKNNVQSFYRREYDICKECNDHGVPYDCSSIMHYGAETFSTGNWTMRPKSKACDLRWVGSAFDGRGATKNDWLLLKRITKPLCSSKKRPRKLRSGKSLKLDSTDRSNLIIN